jgi:phosphatidylglycerol lysyltransferase
METAESSPAMSLERAREIVVALGWNPTSYQILNPGIQHWFSPVDRAVVGYATRGNVLLVAGGPVSEPDALASVCDRFEAFARQRGLRVCYVCAEERLRALFLRSPHHAAMAMGAQPVWNPSTWPEVVRRRPSLRAQLRRAGNKGVVVAPVASARAAADPELRRVLRQWIAGRHLPPLHFLTEPNVLDGVLTDRVILLARRNGAPVAFLVASPAKAREGYLVELLARSPAAPNGSSELLIDAAMRRFADEGCQYATLGLVALAHAADPAIRNNPGWMRMMMYFARAHANRFYNFRGLEYFRLKMAPDRWDTVYAISNEPRFSLQTLYAMGGAFSGIPPWAAIAIGIGKAASAEFQAVARHKWIGRRGR